MSAEPTFIVIPRWDEFQHRDMARSTTPPWIKNYTRLLHDDAYLGLTSHQRAVLHGLWLEYASARRHLVLNTSSLSSRLRLRVMTRDIEALNHAGFITFSASNNASNNASLEVEREEKRKKKGFKSAAPVDETAVAVRVPAASLVTAQTITAFFVEQSKALVGTNPPSRVTGQVASLVGELLREGIAGAQVEAGITLLLEKRLHPSTLPSLVHEASLPAGRAGRNGRVTPSDILARARQLHDQEEEMFHDR